VPAVLHGQAISILYSKGCGAPRLRALVKGFDCPLSLLDFSIRCRVFSLPLGYRSPGKQGINMLAQNEGASKSYQLLNVDSRQQQRKVTDEQESALQGGLDDHPPIQPPGWISKP